MEIKAYAKVNLTLEVLGKRPDGYHEIKSVMQTISLADTLTFLPHKELCLEGSLPGLGEHDLVWRAARELQKATGNEMGALIRVWKSIPAGTGLGGGSSDAAAALKGLNTLWELGLDTQSLSDVAKKLGSDVPFFLLGGTALIEGRGEVLKPLPLIPKMWLVVAYPPISLEGKTRRLYSLIQPSHYTDGSYTERLINQMQARPSLNGLLYNVFEKVADLAYPELHKYLEQLKTAGLRRSMLAGAGPALFSFVKNELEGKEAITKLSVAQTKAYLAHSL